MYVHMHVYMSAYLHVHLFKLLQITNLLSIICSMWNGLSIKKFLFYLCITLWADASWFCQHMCDCISIWHQTWTSKLRRLETQAPTQWLANGVSGLWTRADSCAVYSERRELVRTCHPYNTVAVLYKAAYKLFKHY